MTQWVACETSADDVFPPCRSFLPAKQSGSSSRRSHGKIRLVKIAYGKLRHARLEARPVSTPSLLPQSSATPRARHPPSSSYSTAHPSMPSALNFLPVWSTRRSHLARLAYENYTRRLDTRASWPSSAQPSSQTLV
jgi:hypothetical protein